ncbi:MAG: ATP-binding protein [Phycisphaerales bacterium]
MDVGGAPNLRVRLKAPWRLPLWLRLCIILLAVQLIVAAAFSAWSYTRLREHHRGQTIARIDKALEPLAPFYAEAIANATLPRLSRPLAIDAETAGVRLSLYRPNGVLIASTSPEHADFEPLGDALLPPGSEPGTAAANTPPDEVRRALAAGAATRIARADDDAETGVESMLHYAIRLEHENQTVGVLLAKQPMAEVDRSLQAFVAQITLAGVAGLLIVSIAIVGVALRLGATLGRLANDANRYAHGDLRHRVASPPSRELAQLADSLNEMAGQMSARLAELRVQRSEQEAILRSIDRGIIAIDRDQKILSLNRVAEHMLGKSGEEVRRLPIAQAFDVPELIAFADTAVVDPVGNEVEFTLCPHPHAEHAAADPHHAHEPRHRIDIRATSSPLLNDRSRRVGTILLLSDITQLRKLESLRSDFAANVSHELRTPITNIKGYVETLLEVGQDNREQTQRFLNVIARNADRLGAIVDDILTLTSLERPDATTTIETTTATVRSIAERVRSNLASDARDKGTSLLVNVDSALKVEANTRLIEQAIGNLVENAIKYSAPVSVVQIRAEPATLPSGPGVAIIVEDEGPGIEPEHLPRLFERFYRVDKARSREQGGTGLGLAIAKHIAIVHGGDISAHSEVGVGSEFRLILPTTRATAEPEQPPHSPHRRPQQPRNAAPSPQP